MQIKIKKIQEIFDILYRNRNQLMAYDVKRIGLFGSYLSGNQRSDSDIEMLVEFHPNHKTFDNFMELSFFLEEILQNRIEPCTPESLSPYIGPKILKEVEYAPLAA